MTSPDVIVRSDHKNKNSDDDISTISHIDGHISNISNILSLNKSNYHSMSEND